MQSFKITRSAVVVLAVAVSATAAGFAIQQPPAPVKGSEAAGLAAMTMLDEEHALVAQYATGATQAQREANLAAEREILRVKTAAAEEAVAAQRLALAAEVKAPAPRPRQSGSAQDIAPGEPLQLAAMMNPVQPTPVTARGVVAEKTQAVLRTVKSIPGMLRNAADWVVDLPGQALPRWERRFNISSL
ncbi:MAG: hypothetical protein JO254_02735 [Pseudolabrys sp.]|nr:hypothetical protein [Pseudolabrys sp.]